MGPSMHGGGPSRAIFKPACPGGHGKVTCVIRIHFCDSISSVTALLLAFVYCWIWGVRAARRAACCRASCAVAHCASPLGAGDKPGKDPGLLKLSYATV